MIGIIINADDFGYSKIFNERILDLLRKWFLKSTTVMVDCVEAGQKDQVNDLIELEKRGDIGVWLHIVFDLKVPLYDQIDSQFRKFLDIFPWEFDPNCTSSFNAERIRDYEWIAKLHEYIAKNSNFQIISYKDI